MRRLVSGLLAVLAVTGIACAVTPDDGGSGSQTSDLSEGDVVFSPQPYESSHLPKIAAEIDRAQKSIDVAIYSYSDAKVGAALARAVQRGVKVRLVFNDAGDQERLEGDKKLSSPSGKLEASGVDVRYVNKIMHHKFMIVDGPRDDVSLARTAHLVTGSANWTNGAATSFDENTVFIKENPELLLRFQREFETLWAHSRDFDAKQFPYEHGRAVIADDHIPDVPGSGVFYTSANFDVRDTTFSTNGKNTIADALVTAISGAKKSVHIASGHLRSRPVAEALVAKKKASPEVDIRVYVDAQEYLSKSSHDQQVADRDQCLAAAANNASKVRGCTDKDFLYGYQVAQGGVEVRYKYYAYRWDFSYAPQMHNKFFLIDGETLLTGSYNLSDNAEHGTFENMMQLDGPANASLVRAYETTFERIWNTGRADDLLGKVDHQIDAGGEFPIVFAPMALDWNEVTALKQKIRAACPAIDSQEYREHAAAHTKCTR